MKTLLMTAAALAVATVAAAQTETDENTVALEEVPQAAMDAAMQAAGDAGFAEFEVTAAAMDEDEGTMTYELSGTAADGMALEVDVLEDGTIEEIEQEVAMDTLPDAVMTTLESELAGFEPTMIEKSLRPEGLVVYEFEGTHDGTEIDAEVNEDGSNFVQNEDDAA